jgi:hypothetical protein
VQTELTRVTTKIINNRIKTTGPNQVSCGIEPLRVNHSEKNSNSLTRCMRLVENEHNQRIKNCATLKLYNLRT